MNLKCPSPKQPLEIIVQVLFIAGIFVAIGGVLFALQNNVPVTVTFLFWRFDSSLAVVLLLAVAIGAIVVALLATPATLRRQWATGRQKKRIQELEKESEALKARIATLEASSPASPAAAAPEPPYVGLKQVVLSREAKQAEGATNPAEP